MTDTNDLIQLTTEPYYPKSEKHAFFVQTGCVYVYIVPWKNNEPGQRVFLCEAPAGWTIPALVYRDEEYRHWRFALLAKEEGTEIMLRPNGGNRILQKNFMKRIGLDSFETEGFARGVVDKYQMEIAAQQAFSKKIQESGAGAAQETDQALGRAFSTADVPDPSGTPAYRALKFACSKLKIDLLSPEEIALRCGKDASVEDIAAASRFICRRVVLEADWYKGDCGGLIGTLNNEIVACVPSGAKGYRLYRSGDGSVVPLTEELAHQISPKAHSIGRTLPAKKLTKKDVFRFCKSSVRGSDFVFAAVLTLICALIGVLLPSLNQMIYDDYIPLGNVGNLGQLCVMMLSFMIGNLSFSIVKNLFNFRLTSRVGNDLQNAAYHRLFHLPESFFRKYDSADLAGRAAQIGTTATAVANAILVTGVSALFSIVYLIQMCGYSGKMALIGVGMYLLYSLLSVWFTAMTRKGEVAVAEADAEASSKLYQYLNGVDKLRMAGVEDRALLSYMRPYVRQQRAEIRINRLVSVKEALDGIIGSIFSMVLYLVIVNGKIELSIGAFVAFNSAFGAFTGALDGLVEELLSLYQERESVKRFWPILDTIPEDAPDGDTPKEVLGTMTGAINLTDIRFGYEEGKPVLNGLNLKIKAGEYIGIVGPSGCGKSTLLKLLLGFETPQSGSVTIDGKDLRDVDKGAYRRQLGVVLQNGKLISGSIYENITITAPNVKMSRVNEVIEQVGLREDIDEMPMGIHTVLSENCNTISGGQQQRILIARAIVGTPKVLIFDEATSALDNLTQAAVSSNLDKMNVTRIVVAHRLSTIKNCDRILVLADKDAAEKYHCRVGSIAEEGTYESLMAKKGLFYALASRQIAQ